MKNESLHIIYLVGVGRSGSTIFDIVLGNSHDVEGGGELAYLFEHGFELGEKCSCGETPAECPFFSKVLIEYFAITGSRDFSEYERLRRRVERFSQLPRTLLGLLPSHELHAYLKHTEALYQAIARVSGKRIILDTSKRPGRLALLSRCRTLRLTPVHLVRDGRGYIWSCLKRERKVGIENSKQYSTPRPALKSLIFWLAINFASLLCLLNFRIRRGGNEKTVILRYEDFCRSTSAVLRKIEARTGADVAKLIAMLEAEEALTPGHKIAGNRTKYHDVIQLRYDSAWTKNLGFGYTLLFYILAWPFILFYRLHRVVSKP